MRILVTVPWSERLGGAEAMLQSVLDGAREEGHELELVFFEPGLWPAALADAGFRVSVLPAGRLREIGRGGLTVARLARIFRSRRPDLILNWAAKTHFYGSTAAALVGMSDRVVLWQHSIPASARVDRLATLFPAVAIGCYCREAAEAQSRLFPRRPVFVVAPGTAAPGTTPRPSSDAHSMSAPDSAEDLGSADLSFPVDRSLSPGRSSEDPGRSSNDVPVVGLVGRLQPWKGQDRLLRAQALLRDRGLPFHTLIVGGDAYGLSPEYARSLPALAGRLGLADAVTMTGQVPDAGPYIERMDILVNASDPEPFGIVLLEGMARGVPVVAVDAGGPAEFVQHERTGILARSGEPEALADALAPLLASSELRRNLGGAGRELFGREFTDAAMRGRFFANLERLRGEREAGHRGRGRHTKCATERQQCHG
jgi:glycosyltransferase involved in cell wall biosynthesis